jgi:hypothetical protein
LSKARLPRRSNRGAGSDLRTCRTIHKWHAISGVRQHTTEGSRYLGDFSVNIWVSPGKGQGTGRIEITAPSVPLWRKEACVAAGIESLSRQRSSLLLHRPSSQCRRLSHNNWRLSSGAPPIAPTGMRVKVCCRTKGPSTIRGCRGPGRYPRAPGRLPQSSSADRT